MFARKKFLLFVQNRFGFHVAAVAEFASVFVCTFSFSPELP